MNPIIVVQLESSAIAQPLPEQLPEQRVVLDGVSWQ
jgi:hypothetical protein